ncbi:MAG: hypothetical protein GX630_06350 [Actinobacteria bacterium]|nr:hypothetical protein [Actinomycetota bacterium]
MGEGVLTLALISVAVGLVLAFAYHLLSMRLQTWIVSHKAAMVPVVTILGFVVRLGLIAIILVVLSLWTPLNILALCISFIVVFTILTGFSLYRLMLARRRGVPPSAGASGAN